ncbi:hypothetical protein [Brevibacillus sp. NRS-1366]|uniref:hypothetical protein n=1 Tax=Brevibacillus sp. NRS-1366 TaxID=3233899 RepID=UPI003D2638D3
MGEINWITVLTNSIISLILSFTMFAFGLRAGKERTDRVKLRETYREIYSHINKLLEGISENKPLNWNHFQNSAHSDSKPPCKEMMKTGEHLELSKNLFPNIVELEKDCLIYGWHFKQLTLKSGELVIKVLEENSIPLKKEQYRILTTIENSDDKDGSYIEIKPTNLLSDQKYEQYLNRISNNDIGIHFTYVDQSKVIFSIYIRKCDIQHINMAKVFSEIRTLLEKNQDDFMSKKDEILKRLEKTLLMLGKLIKDPHSFWGTLVNTFKDFFR